MKIHLQDIRSNFEGFCRLVSFGKLIDTALWEDIDIDMSAVNWIDANMCAPLGALVHKATQEGNAVTINNIISGVQSILSKNGFLAHYGYSRLFDSWGSTIQYKRFETKDDHYFADYISRELAGKNIPTMTPALYKKFQESLFEIFSNAVIHSQTTLGIFSCGQYFHRKKRLDFSVADLGLGMRGIVKDRLNLDLTPEDAIIWSLSGNNTTKRGSVPGGLGLKLLQEFIRKNKGRIQIASDKGYWELINGDSNTQVLPHPFPGTVVNIEINTADTHSYCLACEIRPDEIF